MDNPDTKSLETDLQTKVAEWMALEAESDTTLARIRDLQAQQTALRDRADALRREVAEITKTIGPRVVMIGSIFGSNGLYVPAPAPNSFTNSVYPQIVPIISSYQQTTKSQ